MWAPKTCENFDRYKWHSMDGNEEDFVHVSLSYELYIPFMFYTYKILSLGSIYWLKVLEEIKSKVITIIIIVITTSLLISSETNAEWVGTFSKFTSKRRRDSLLRITAVPCISIEHCHFVWPHMIAEEWIAWTPIISLALRSLDLIFTPAVLISIVAVLYYQAAWVVR